GLLKRLQQARAIAQDMPRGDRYRALKLGRRESPPFSLVAGRAVNHAFGDVIPVSPLALGGSLHVQRLTSCVKGLLCHRTRNRPVRASPSPRRILFEPLLDPLPEFWWKNRLVLPRMALLLVADLADVNRVGQQLVRCSTREPAPSRLDALARDPDFRLYPSLLQFLAQLPDAPQFQVALIDVPDSFGFRTINDQPPVTNVVAERRHASHPHPFALGGSDFVPDALACDLALELGKRKQDVEGQPAHRAGGVELLRDGDERHSVRIEQFDHLGE